GAAGAATGARQVAFADPLVAQHARELAAEKLAQVTYLRSLADTKKAAQPAIDLGTAADGAFSTIARSAGLVGAGQSFDPYASDNNFLLGAFLFEDVMVTAYKGLLPVIRVTEVRAAIAGLLGASSYHAGLIRTALYARGAATASLRAATVSLSDARDALDGNADKDQGVTGTATASNVVPANTNGIAFSRTAGQALSIAFLSKVATNKGGFFPSGVNGTVVNSSTS
ncbi:MAG TPA: ferritin-like domain-containing protein, partial [Allosphingosinicella sp.]